MSPISKCDMDKDKYCIAYVPENNTKFINLYIYSKKTNKIN